MINRTLTDCCSRTLIDCIQFVKMLNERGAVAAMFFKMLDLKMIKAYHAEVKKRGEEIEVI